MKRILRTLVSIWRSESYTGKKIYILLALIALMIVIRLCIEFAGS